MTTDANVGRAIFVGESISKEIRSFQVKITRSSCTKTWMWSFEERAMAEEMGFNIFAPHKESFLACGSGAHVASEHLRGLLGKYSHETAEEIEQKILVAANQTTLQVDTVGGNLTVLISLHGDTFPSVRVHSPPEIQLADTGSFSKILLLRVAPSLCKLPIYQDKIIDEIATDEFKLDGVVRTTYFFSREQGPRYWRMWTGNQQAGIVLNRITARLGTVAPLHDGFNSIAVLPFGTGVSIARCSTQILQRM